MYRTKKLDAMLSEISANIENLERDLKEEYKKLMRISSDFNDISAEIVLLERKELPQSVREYEATAIADKLFARLGATLGPERGRVIILEAAEAIMDENRSGAVVSRN